MQDARPHSLMRPATVISTLSGNLSEENIVDGITSFLARDDVYSEDFASTIVIQMPTGIAQESPLDLSSFEQYNLKNSWLEYSIAMPTENLLPSGPYFIHDNGIYEAWRLYPDELDTFEFAVVPQDTKGPAR